MIPVSLKHSFNHFKSRPRAEPLLCVTPDSIANQSARWLLCALTSNKIVNITAACMNGAGVCLSVSVSVGGGGGGGRLIKTIYLDSRPTGLSHRVLRQ